MMLKLAKNTRHRDLEANEWFYLIPEFHNLTSGQSHFVALVADFESKIPKGLPDRKRREMAASLAGWGVRKDRQQGLDSRGLELAGGKVPGVEAAILKYRELQKELNEDYAHLVFVNERLDHLKQLIASPSTDLADEKTKTGLTKELWDLYERKKAFEAKIGKDPDPLIIGEESAEGEDNTRTKSLIDRENEKLIPD
jgi:hypothetical protein